jgi:putative proteasome-type protease
MTFCLAMRLKDGLVGITDTRLTSAQIDFVITGKKIYLYEDGHNHALFLMVSGLKSVSDELITYLNEKTEQLFSFKRLYQAVDIICETLRGVREREEEWLTKEDYPFDINIIVGGQFPEDGKCCLFRIFPEGSWKRVVRDTPYEIIGEIKYGKPILDIALDINTPIDKALMLGLISYDFTRKSTPLVSPPIDIVTLELNKFKFTTKRLHDQDLLNFSKKWEEKFLDSLAQMEPREHLPQGL